MAEFRGRKLFVSNLRSKDGRRLEPKLTMLDSTGKRWMTLTKRDFEQLMKWKKELDKAGSAPHRVVRGLLEAI